MKSPATPPFRVRRITKDDGQYFFGYYDVLAWSPDNRRHLCHKVAFWDRLPGKDDVAEIGLIDLDSLRYEPLAQTTAWNFQQGAMLQWRPGSGGRQVIFNVRQDGAYRGVIMDIHSGKRSTLELPVANVDPSGRYALSINFDRMFDFRPGYGYAGRKDPHYAQDHPEDDGVFLIDLETGRATLILSLDQVYAVSRQWLYPDCQKLVINHLTFNTAGTRFVFLARHFPRPGENHRTLVATAARDGSDMYCLTDYRHASHYTWMDESRLLIHVGGKDGNQLYLLTDKTDRAEAIDVNLFRPDGHCNFSPDRKRFLYDNYPDKDGNQRLFIYDLSRREKVPIGVFPSKCTGPFDIRCDLHARWNSSGDAVSFDSTHEGFRGIYMAG